MATWLKTSEVAAIVGVTPQRINFLRRDRQLDGHMSHGSWRYRPTAVADLQKKRRTNPRVKKYRRSASGRKSWGQLSIDFDKSSRKKAQDNMPVADIFEVGPAPAGGSTGRQLALLFDCLEAGLFSPAEVVAAGRKLVKR